MSVNNVPVCCLQVRTNKRYAYDVPVCTAVVTWLLISACCLQVRTNKRYAGAGTFTVSEVAERVKADVGNIDIVVSWRR
jgi:hypothetical protein